MESLKWKWNDLTEKYSEEKARIIEDMGKISPASDEYTRMVDNLKTLQTVESQDADNLVNVREQDLKEREQDWTEAKDTAEAHKPEIGKKDWLQILVPAGCVVLTLALEFGANGVVTSKVFQKLPFFRG